MLEIVEAAWYGEPKIVRPGRGALNQMQSNGFIRKVFYRALPVKGEVELLIQKKIQAILQDFEAILQYFKAILQDFQANSTGF